jgi:hypothetical protein
MWPVGTDVRKLVYDGYPAENVFACDIRHEFIDIGYELFNDKDQCKIHFFQSDVFEIPLDPLPSAGAGDLGNVAHLRQLQGRVDQIYTGALFHLVGTMCRKYSKEADVWNDQFDESTQFAIALRLVTLLAKDRPAVIFGRHRGQISGGIVPGIRRSFF